MWLILSALVVALLSVWFFFSRKPKHPVDLLPGPPSLPIIGTTLNFVKGREGAKWHSRRKLLTPAFHFSILEQFVPVFCDKTRTLIEKLRTAASENPDGVDIVPYVTRCALDIICLGGKKRKFAFLDLLIKASENDPTLTDDDIREEVDTFMFEGHDTTAMAMSWTIYFLGKHSEIQSRCVEELEEIFCGSDRDPNLTDLGNMKYLERVIKESLRLRPSVLSVGRMVKQPLKLSQRFAMLEMKEILSNVLRHFRLETIDPEHHYEALPDLILRPKYGISMRLFPREIS
ncbi:hypothetical protein B566_EDAN002844 [Ephemera danica]|nr:hypothetical protein B566_EDAN002844 [Ephemera danica]